MGLCQVLSAHWDRSEEVVGAIKRAKEAGYDMIELPLLKSPLECGVALQALRDYDLVPSCSTGLAFDDGKASFEPKPAKVCTVCYVFPLLISTSRTFSDYCVSH